MITFKQYLAEAFDKPYPIRVYESSNPKEIMFFEFTDVDGVTFECNISTNRTVGSNKQVASIRFGIKGERGTAAVYPSGKSSNAMRVYATIGMALKKFLQGNQDIDFIMYEAAHSKTSKIYSAFADRIAKSVNGTVIDRGVEKWIRINK